MLRTLDFILLAVGEPLDDFKQEETSQFALKNNQSGGRKWILKIISLEAGLLL